MPHRFTFLFALLLAVQLPLQSSDQDIVDEIMNGTKLRAAVRAGDLQEIKRLLALGVNVNAHGVPERFAQKYAAIQEGGVVIGPNAVGTEFNKMPWPGSVKNVHKEMTKLILPHLKMEYADFSPWDKAAPVILPREDVADQEQNGFWRPTPLRVAIINKQFEAAKLLIEKGAVTNNASEFGPALYDLAVKNADGPMIKLLVEKGATVPRNGVALLTAAKQGDLELVKFLVANGSPINTSPSPLVGLIRHHEPIVRDGKALSQEESDKLRLEIIKFFLAKGANTNLRARAYGGQPPLYACLDAVDGPLRKPLVELLLSKKANASCRAQFHMTPLHLLCMADEPDLALIKLLLEKGAKVNAVLTPDAIVKDGKVETSFYPETKVVVTEVPEHDRLGKYTALHMALRNYLLKPSQTKAELVKLLISKRGNVNAITRVGLLPLHMLAVMGKPGAGDASLRTTAVDLAACILDARADVNAKRGTKEDYEARRAPSGPTALEMAVENARPELAGLLLDRGAKVNMESASEQVKAFMASYKRKPPQRVPKSDPVAKKDAASEPPPKAEPARKAPPAKAAAKGVKKIVVLKDGREIKATIVMAMGKQLAVKDIEGKMHQIAKDDVQEIRNPQ